MAPSQLAMNLHKKAHKLKRIFVVKQLIHLGDESHELPPNFLRFPKNHCINQCELVNRADGVSQIEGKAARVAASEQGSERVQIRVKPCCAIPCTATAWQIPSHASL